MFMPLFWFTSYKMGIQLHVGLWKPNRLKLFRQFSYRLSIYLYLNLALLLFSAQYFHCFSLYDAFLRNRCRFAPVKSVEWFISAINKLLSQSYFRLTEIFRRPRHSNVNFDNGTVKPKSINVPKINMIGMTFAWKVPITLQLNVLKKLPPIHKWQINFRSILIVNSSLLHARARVCVSKTKSVRAKIGRGCERPTHGCLLSLFFLLAL